MSLYSRPIARGKRWITLWNVARRKELKNVHALGVLKKLREINLRCCRPPLPDDKIVRLAAYASSRREAAR